MGSTAPSTTGQFRETFYGGRKFREVRQRVTLNAASAYQMLGTRANIPGRARIAWIRLIANTSVAMTAGNTNVTADSIALIMFPTSGTSAVTAPPSTATASNPTGTNGWILGLVTGTASNTEYNDVGFFETSAPTRNRFSAEAALAIIPAQSSSAKIQINGTTGMIFGSATDATGTVGQIDVWVATDYMEDAPVWNPLSA